MQFIAAATTGWVHGGLLIASVATAVAWLLLQRRHIASALLSVGAALNLVVIAVNGGMPVDDGALAAVGRRGTDVTNGFLYKHVALTAGTKLAFLADRIPIPVQRNVISIGDVVMAVAIGVWISDAVGGRFAPRRATCRATRQSTCAVHGQHRGRTRRKRIGPREGAQSNEDGVGGLASSQPSMDFNGEIGSGLRRQRSGRRDERVAASLCQQSGPTRDTDVAGHPGATERA